MVKTFVLLVLVFCMPMKVLATDPVTEKPKHKKFKFTKKNISMSGTAMIGGTILFSAGLISKTTNVDNDRSGFSGISRYTSPDGLAMVMGASLFTIGIVIKL
jgi:hypothetical protein